MAPLSSHSASVFCSSSSTQPGHLLDGRVDGGLQRVLLLGGQLAPDPADDHEVGVRLVRGQADEVLHLVEADRVDVDDRVLLAVDRPLLEGQEQLLVGHLGGIGAERLGVHQELRRVREPHPQPFEVPGLTDRLVRRELPHARRPGAEGVDPGLLLEPLEERRRRRRSSKNRARWSLSSNAYAASSTLTGS